jgi:cold shock CspA family protein
MTPEQCQACTIDALFLVQLIDDADKTYLQIRFQIKPDAPSTHARLVMTRQAMQYFSVGGRPSAPVDWVAIVDQYVRCITHRHQGVCIEWNPSVGWGFVLVGTRKIFIHHTQLCMDGFRKLKMGQQVHLQLIPGRVHPQHLMGIQVTLL